MTIELWGPRKTLQEFVWVATASTSRYRPLPSQYRPAPATLRQKAALRARSGCRPRRFVVRRFFGWRPRTVAVSSSVNLPPLLPPIAIRMQAKPLGQRRNARTCNRFFLRNLREPISDVCGHARKAQVRGHCLHRRSPEDRPGTRGQLGLIAGKCTAFARPTSHDTGAAKSYPDCRLPAIRPNDFSPSLPRQGRADNPGGVLSSISSRTQLRRRSAGPRE